MNNADSPAMPRQIPVANIEFETEGLTKREYAAIHAPNMPSWFDLKYSHDKEWDPIEKLNFEKQSEMHFAWVKYYADNVLAELDKD